MDEEMRTSELGRLLTSLEVIEIELEILYDIVMEERFEPNGESFTIWISDLEGKWQAVLD